MELTNIIREDFVKFTPETKISEIVGEMINGEEAVAIFDENNFIGIISITDIITRDYPVETKAKNLVRRNVPKININADFINIAKVFLENNIKAVPVFEEEELKGLLYEKDDYQTKDT